MQYKVAGVKWTHVENENIFLSNPSSSGHGRLLMKLGNAQNQSYPVIPIAVREVFSMTDATDRSEDYTVNVLFF